MGPPEFAGRLVTGAPYSAVETTTEMQVLADGTTIQHQRTTSAARDSQGRMRTETTVMRRGPNSQNGASPSGTAVKEITIHDPVAGVMRHVDTEAKVVHEMPAHMPPPGARQGQGRGPRPDVARAQRPADPNVKTEDLGTQVINGETAKGTRVTRTIPAGAEGNSAAIQSVRETWVSAELKIPVMIKTSDPRHGASVTQLTNISHVEPDAALFQAPADYTVQRGPGPGRGGRGPGGPGGPRNQNRN